MIESGEVIKNIDLFENSGFSAGMVLKGNWTVQDDIYDNIRSLVSDDRVKLIIPKQVHNSDLVLIDNSNFADDHRADGLMSRSGDFCLTVRTADCLPLLIADKSNGLFAAVHVGWRGFAAGIINETISTFNRHGSAPENLLVHLGPSIGKCCYEVGGEVAVLFEREFFDIRDDRYFLDLSGAARNKLLKLGVNESNMGISTECTCCGESDYYSYRRQGQAPLQMVSYIFKS